MLSWQQRIDEARKEVGWFRKSPQGFSDEDVALAADWMTCSCGQLDLRIPRSFVQSEAMLKSNNTNVGAPLDDELRWMGVKFHEAVRDDHIDRAEVLYRKIQARAELLIEQLEQPAVAEQSEEVPQA